MEQIYIPYVGNRPATVDINGHKIVILSSNREQLEDYLDLVGGDHIFSVEEDEFSTANDILEGVSQAANAKVFLSPPELELPQVLDGLKQSLPWPQ